MCVSPKKTCCSSISNFDSQKHCLFCDETCNIEKDPTHPGYWRNAFLCRTVVYKSAGEVEIKQEILRTCQTHVEKWSAGVQILVLGAVNDLHAADARYHAECKLNFMSPRHVHVAIATTSSSSKRAESNSSFEHVTEVILEDKSVCGMI